MDLQVPGRLSLHLQKVGNGVLGGYDKNLPGKVQRRLARLGPGRGTKGHRCESTGRKRHPKLDWQSRANRDYVRHLYSFKDSREILRQQNTIEISDLKKY